MINTHFLHLNKNRDNISETLNICFYIRWEGIGRPNIEQKERCVGFNSFQFTGQNGHNKFLLLCIGENGVE